MNRFVVTHPWRVDPVVSMIHRFVFAALMLLAVWVPSTSYASFPATSTNGCTSGTCRQWQWEHSTTGVWYDSLGHACEALPALWSAYYGSGYFFTWVYTSEPSCVGDYKTPSSGGVSFGGFGMASRYVTPELACPANSSLSGSTCTCNTDYSENADHNACVKNTPAQAETALGQQTPAGMCTKAPILPATGEKYYTHSDFSDTTPHPLSLNRTYRSRWSVSGSPGFTANPGLGQSWAHNHSDALQVVANTSATLIQGNGSTSAFTWNASTSTWTAATGTSTLVATTTPTTGYLLKSSDDDSRWQFDTAGKLLTKTERNGWTTTYSYIASGNGAGQLGSVTNAFGRSISFAYNSAGQLTSATMPDGQVVSYTFDSSARLITVGYPGNVSKTYLYEDSRWPQSVTGINDERGIRLATVVYDAQGRAVESGYAGGADYYKVAYPATTAWTSAQVTDPLGTTRNYSYGTTLGKLTVTGADKPSENSGSRGGSDAASRVQNANGLLDSETDFTGVQTMYTWDSTRRLPLSTTQAAGRPEALTTSTQWHATWRLPVLVTEPGRTTATSYDTVGNPLSETTTDTTGGPSNGTNSPSSRTWAWTYLTTGGAANNLVATQTDPLGKVWSFAYNPQGQRTSATNPLGQVTSYTYDTAGRLASQTEPGANGTNLVTSYSYDLRGRLTQVSAGGETTSYTYTASGQIASVTLPNGYAISYTYDAAQRLTAATDNRGNRTSYTLDGMGNRVREELKDPSGTIAWATSRTINSLNRVSAVANALGQSTQFGFDANGEATSQTDPLSHTTTQTLDALRRPVSSTLPDNSSTSTAWTALNELASAKDPKGITTSYQRNAWGEVLSETSPDSGTQSYTRDAAGQIASKTDALGKTTSYQRDDLGRPTTITLSDGKTQTLAYTAAGNLAQITDPSGSTSYTYDILGRLLSKTQTVNDNPANPGSTTTAYAYHPGGTLARITYPSGLKVFYRLGTGSNVGRIVQVDVQRPGANTPVQAFIAGLKYTALNQPRAWYWLCGTPNACDNAGRSFNADGRMTGTEFSYYGYDAAGRLNRIDQYLWTLQDAVPASGSNPEIPSKLDRTIIQWTAGYDSRDRLNAFNRSGASTGLVYDANGNRTYAQTSVRSDIDLNGDFDQSDTLTNSYLLTQVRFPQLSSTSNRLLGFTQTQTTKQVSNGTVLGTSSTQVSYQLDAAGNLTSDGLRQFGYDAANRLSEVKVSDTDEASKILYLHNALGQRVFKSDPQVAQTAPNASELGTDFISWLQQSFSWLFTPTSQSTAMLGQAYVYGESSIGSYNLLGEYGNGSSTSPGSTEYIWLPIEGGPAQAIGLYRDNRFYGVHSDHLGTPRLITDDSGKAVWQWAYSAFGDNKPSGPFTSSPKTASGKSINLLKGTSPGITMNLRLPGQYFDSESNLSYNFMRSYQPNQGRYMQPDPIGLAGGWSRFGYVEGNPLLAIDPNGLSKVQGQPSIGGSDSAVSGITKASTKAEVEAAIKRAEEVIKDPKANPLRKKFLKGWIKVAKRGFTKSFCPPFLEDIVTAVTRELCLGGDQMACQLFEDMGGEIVRPYD
jgi:RHS repeat-associated protein